MNTKLTDVLGPIEAYRFNPGQMQRSILQFLRKATNEEVEIVDPTNPFVFALEATTATTTAFMQHCESLNRKQYPAAAVTTNDLYLHMSDKDYIGRFALPSKTKFTIILGKEELLNSLIPDNVNNISKITIPRNSLFTVAGVKFSLQYPIDIRRMQHGGLQIVYDTTTVSPLYTLETNIIDWEEVSDPQNNKYISFSFDVHQFDIITKLNDVTSSSGHITNVAFDDDFYHARVWMQDDNSNWLEIQTTHTDQLYNPSTPTAVLKVSDKLLEVSIPSVYATSGLISGKLRVDLYQTKGNINMLLSNYNLDNFSAKWLSIDSNDSTVYSTAINNFKTLLTYSTGATTGGRKALSLNELTSRVINNSIGPQQLPITQIQLENSIKDAGYDIVKNVDTITDRVFLATKEMTQPIDNKLITSAASSMSRVTLTLPEAAQAYGVTVVGDKMIISSEALYKNEEGITKLVSAGEYSSIQALNNTSKAEHLNNNNYTYSPFHYILTTKENKTFSVNPYYLDSPKITNRSFISENVASGLQVSIGQNYFIEKTPLGYELTITTKSNESFKELDDESVFCQIAFKSQNQTLYSYLLAEQSPRQTNTDERTYVFKMQSNFELNEIHQIAQKSFRFGTTNLSTYCDLNQEMHILFVTNAPRGNSRANTEADDLLGKFQLPENAYAISHEKLKIKFGDFLDHLWSRSKTIFGPSQYLTYTEDVIAKYEKDIYKTDAATGASFRVVNNELVYDILHAKGSNVLDSSGNPVIKHRRGDVVLNSVGEPILAQGQTNQLIRYVDIATIEGSYRFATDPSSEVYKSQMTESMVSWITEDIPKLNLSLLDQTKIFFYPKVTQGYIECIAGNRLTVNIEANQSFTATLQVSPEVYDNSALKEEITKITVSVINEQLNNSTIAISDIEYELKNRYGGDVIDVKLLGLGKDNQYNALTVVDKTNKISIRKFLTVLPNNLLILEEDVSVNFVKHSKN